MSMTLLNIQLRANDLWVRRYTVHVSLPYNTCRNTGLWFLRSLPTDSFVQSLISQNIRVLWWSNFYPKPHRLGAIESIFWKNGNHNYIKKFTWLLQQNLYLTDRSMPAFNEHRFSKLRQLNCILNDSIRYCRSSRQLPRLIDVDLALRACNSSRRIHVSVDGVFSDYITRRLTSLKRVKDLFRIKTNYFHFNWHLICTDILKKNDI